MTVTLLFRFSEAYGKSSTEADRLELDFDDNSELERQILDAPDLYSAKLRQMLTQLDVSRDFNKILKIYMFFGWEATLNQHQSGQQIELVLNETKQRKLYWEYALIKSGVVFEKMASAPNGIPAFENLIQEVSSFHEKQSLAYAQTMYGHHLLQNRNNKEAFDKIVGAKEILDGVKQPSLLAKVQVESAFGDALYESGKLEASLAARTELDKLLLRLGIRSRRAFNLYNIGIFYCKREQPGDLAQARELFQESLQLAASVKSANIEALAHYGLSTVAFRKRSFEEAIDHAGRTLNYYDSGGPDDGWKPRILRRLAEAYLGAKKYPESLRYIARAEEILPKTNRVGLNELTYLRYRNAKEQSEWQKATELLDKYLETFRILAKESEQEQYQKSAVDLGLKFEEERSNHLKEQVELLQKFRWMTFLASSLLIVSLAALGVVIRQRKSLQKSRTLMNRAHNQIAEKNKEMQIFIDEIPGALASFDTELNVLAENGSYKALLLDKDQELLNTVLEQVIQFQIENREFNSVRIDLSTSSKIRSYDISLKRYIHQLKTCTLLLMIDVSLRVELEKALEAERIRNINSARLQGLGELAGGIAHEINNPLAIIGGRADQIGGIIEQFGTTHPLDAKFQYALKSAKNIQETVLRISKIIIQLRNFARDSSLDAAEYCSIGPMIDDTMLLLNEKLQKHGIEIVVHNEATEVQTLIVRQQVIHVFTILIQNAMDASIDSPIKKIIITISSTVQGKLQISVSDFGAGIKDSSKLFLAFYTTKEFGEGMGLGLSTAYGIIKSQGGAIYLSSLSNPTTFTIELPIIAQNSLASAS